MKTKINKSRFFNDKELEKEVRLTDEEAEQELLEVYGTQEAVDAAIQRIKEHAERCIEEARNKLKGEDNGRC